MSSWADVERFAIALPGVTGGLTTGTRSWQVRRKGFVLERPLGKNDRCLLGDAAPDPELDILGFRVEHAGAKEALLQADPEVFFTIAHYDGFDGLLLLLDRVAPPDLQEVVEEAWLAVAPPVLTGPWLAERR